MKRALIFGLLLLGGCSGSKRPAHDFVLEAIDLSSEETTLASYKGKVVLLDFWATWCEPCKDTIPIINQMNVEFKDKGLVVLGASSEQKSKIAMFQVANKITYELVMDRSGAAQRAYGVSKLPHLFLINKNGEIVYEHDGAGFEYETLRDAVKSALQ